jgi:hypothetical protein
MAWLAALDMAEAVGTARAVFAPRSSLPEERVCLLGALASIVPSDGQPAPPEPSEGAEEALGEPRARSVVVGA